MYAAIRYPLVRYHLPRLDGFGGILRICLGEETEIVKSCGFPFVGGQEDFHGVGRGAGANHRLKTHGR